MSLFRAGAALNVLVLWAGQKASADALGPILSEKTPTDVDVQIITRSQGINRFSEMSQSAIDASDCILMIAADEDWPAAQSARGEWEYFCDLGRHAQKRESQWRWIKTAGRPCPRYPSAGTRMLSVRDPVAPTDRELANILDFIEDERARKAGTPRSIPLNAETVGYPSARLAATLWLILLNESSWDLDEEGGNFLIRNGTLTEGLKYLKALHSIHAGLGAVIRDPLEQLVNLGPEIRTDPNRARAALKDLARSHQLWLEANLQDCIGQGLLPALHAFGRRLELMPASEHERRFVAAASERLQAILSQSEDLQHDDARQPGIWWLLGYSKLLDRIKVQARGFLLDGEALAIVRSEAPGERIAQLRETFDHALRLHASTLELTLAVLTLFSFLHAHRSVPVESLEIDDIGHVLDQVREDWDACPVTDRVVNWSNKLIRDHLAAVEEYEDALHATV